jgi:hypothetical protein
VAGFANRSSPNPRPTRHDARTLLDQQILHSVKRHCSSELDCGPRRLPDEAVDIETSLEPLAIGALAIAYRTDMAPQKKQKIGNSYPCVRRGRPLIIALWGNSTMSRLLTPTHGRIDSTHDRGRGPAVSVEDAVGTN